MVLRVHCLNFHAWTNDFKIQEWNGSLGWQDSELYFLRAQYATKTWYSSDRI